MSEISKQVEVLQELLANETSPIAVANEKLKNDIAVFEERQLQVGRVHLTQLNWTWGYSIQKHPSHIN